MFVSGNRETLSALTFFGRKKYSVLSYKVNLLIYILVFFYSWTEIVSSSLNHICKWLDCCMLRLECLDKAACLPWISLVERTIFLFLTEWIYLFGLLFSICLIQIVGTCVASSHTCPRVASEFWSLQNILSTSGPHPNMSNYFSCLCMFVP